MQFHFEPNLKHQTDAINSVVRIFEGAPYTRPEERIWLGDVSSNILKTTPEQIQENVAKIAEEQGFGEDYSPTPDMDFTVEMETGTGKTYVYIRTIYQLYRQYGLHKFIIVVPSVAIREGVLSTLRDTSHHFQEIYGVKPSVVNYDSKKLNQVQSFCVSNHLSIMVMNKQAFDSDKKVINAEDRDSGNLLEKLQQVRPIIIMDEPQEGMDTENMQARMAAFNPLFKLRYSATHREPKNVVNRLSPYDAYNMGLVKKIAVLSIHETNTQSNVAIGFKKLNLSASNPTATLVLNVRQKSGDIKSKPVTVKRLDNLEKKTGNPVYHGWTVDNIGTTDLYDGEGFVLFTNGEKITEGSRLGSDKETIFREQIRRTIQTHFRRKKQLLPMGIKPLALFFIDRVANYTDVDSLIRRLFIEEYTSLYRQEYGKDATDIDSVHKGYFAKTTSGEYTDNQRTMATNKEIYYKILRDKSTLLAEDEPLEFIFSHSALGVGWDNPNVFTICTLNESESQIKKRQEIGRGLRLCVDQHGKRYRDPEETQEGKEVNLLTVIPNESYYSFVSTYQDELCEEMGVNAKAPKMRNDNKTPVSVRRNEARFTSEDFRLLWEKIARKTRCRVHFREESLIEQGIAALSEIVTGENTLEISLNRWNSMSAEDIEAQHQGATTAALSGRFSTLNVVEELAKNTTLAVSTTAAMIAALPQAQKTMLARNPMQFMAEATKALRHIVSQELVRLVKYEPLSDTLPLDLFTVEEETKRDITPTPKRGLYDHIIHDSDIEKRMAQDLDNQHTVRVFLKLPNAYKIPTPIGNYTPDFALVIEKRNLDKPQEESRFYFTIETKGTDRGEKLKPEEWMKIQCAVKHFEALGMEGYLAPVDDLQSFDNKARAKAGQTFFTG
ncbi:MAG: DEAD/DEAH box helicase family protein [Sphaerospermopsis sp. SIO1G2]|nr:DEAD/DEAH box helicase family protein [Sphaerospermopsis sp. SIO1G2]